MKITNAVRRSAIAVVAVAALGAAVSLAQDNPPPKGPPVKVEVKIDKESARAAGTSIADYAKRDVALKGGYFLLWDAEAKKAVVLTLKKVHDDRAMCLDDGTYVCCTEFTSDTGTVYDVDFFMVKPASTSPGASSREMVPSQIVIHSVDGVERFQWSEKDGVWKKSK